MRDDERRTVKIELLSQWKLEAEFRKIQINNVMSGQFHTLAMFCNCTCTLYKIAPNELRFFQCHPYRQFVSSD